MCKKNEKRDEREQRVIANFLSLLFWSLDHQQHHIMSAYNIIAA